MDSGRFCIRPATLLTIILIGLLRVHCFSQTQQQRPSSADQTEERLAMQYFQQRDYEKATDILERLFVKNERKPYLYTYYFLSLTELKRYDEARKAARLMQKQYPDQPAWEVDEAYAYYLEGNARKAERMFANLINRSSASQQMVLQTANAFRSKGLTNQALETYEKGKNLFPDPDALLADKASIYEMAGDFRNATDTYIDLLMVNPKMLENIKGRLQFSLAQDIENERAEYLKSKLLATLQKNPDNLQLAQLLMWFSLQKKDFSTALRQAEALDVRFKAGGNEVLQLARISEGNGDQTTALDALDYLTKRYQGTGIGQEAMLLRLDIRYDQFMDTPVVTEHQKKELEKEIRENLTAVSDRFTSFRLTRYLAHLLAFYMNRSDEAITLLESSITPGVESSDIKMELGDIYLQIGRVWDANLMYAQAAKESHDDERGEEARFRQARLSFYIGEFDWAKAQLDILKSATSRLIANDAMELSLLIADNMDPDSTYSTLQLYARADMLAHRKQFNASLALLDTLESGFLSHPIQDEVILKKADIYNELGEYQIADSLYARLYTFFPDGIWADKALFVRAKLLDLKLNQPKKALPVYELLITRFGSSFYADEARRRYREIVNSNQTDPSS